MKANIFIPKKINVGFQERSDTYTNQLAYIIYYDEKGKLRKETSWNSWRDEKIDNVVAENVPTSGFVLNKKAGGYSSGWNHRQTYVRVYDPRGFEFEIGISNLLYILENTSSIKGKGLEGEFVYGWDGKDLVLIPTESPDYIEITKLNEIIHENNFIKAKDLKLGATYLTKDNEEYIYMGKYDEYDCYGKKEKNKSFYFAYKYTSSFNDKEEYYFKTMKSLSKKFISAVSEDPAENYADLFDQLERDNSYSPIDDSKDEYTPYTKEEIEHRILNGRRRYMYVYSEIDGTMSSNEIMYWSDKWQYYKTELVKRTGWAGRISEYTDRVRKNAKDLEELMEKLKPMKRKQFLANGKLYKEDI